MECTTTANQPRREEQADLFTLPHELISQSLSYLDIYSLEQARATCKKLKELAENPLLWRVHCERFSPPSQGIHSDDARQIAISRLQSEHAWLDPDQVIASRQLLGHKGGVRGVQSLELSGQLHLVGWSDDYTLRIWDPLAEEGHECVRVLKGHMSWVEDVQLIELSDRLLFVSCSGDRTIRVWDPQEEKGHECVRVLAGHTQGVNTGSYGCPIDRAQRSAPPDKLFMGQNASPLGSPGERGT